MAERRSRVRLVTACHIISYINHIILYDIDDIETYTHVKTSSESHYRSQTLNTHPNNLT